MMTKRRLSRDAAKISPSHRLLHTQRKIDDPLLASRIHPTRDILALQRQIGNQAVQQLISGTAGKQTVAAEAKSPNPTSKTASARTIQRQLVPYQDLGAGYYEDTRAPSSLFYRENRYTPTLTGWYREVDRQFYYNAQTRQYRAVDGRYWDPVTNAYFTEYQNTYIAADQSVFYYYDWQYHTQPPIEERHQLLSMRNDFERLEYLVRNHGNQDGVRIFDRLKNQYRTTQRVLGDMNTTNDVGFSTEKGCAYCSLADLLGKKVSEFLMRCGKTKEEVESEAGIRATGIEAWVSLKTMQACTGETYADWKSLALALKDKDVDGLLGWAGHVIRIKRVDNVIRLWDPQSPNWYPVGDMGLLYLVSLT